ncbi:MAG TPA: hemerythrin domain-containing protein [Anaerolineales bacterium]|nr:hemerythrin domain-containing protein [Anaerolineales bacterium]
MKATHILMEEHRTIERVLTALETGARRLQAGQFVRPEFFLEACEFVQGFADGWHHKKEEGVLFPALASAGIPESGPLRVMLAEHEEGRRLIAALRAGAQRMHGGDASRQEAVVQNALGYVALLRGHIAKEDQVLFAMADQTLTATEADEVARGFERVEHEELGEATRARFLALADSLQTQAEEAPRT